MNHALRSLAGLAGIAIFAINAAEAAPVVFSGTGAATAGVFDSFRTAIGGGSRIAWDGVRLDGTDINPNTKVIDPGKTVEIPVDRFRAVGAIYADPYTVSGDGFASVNPGTAGQFKAFTPSNTFAMFDTKPGSFDDRFIEQTFVIPGTHTEAATRGFGAIFLDNEIAGASKIEYFGRDAKGQSVSLGSYDVPVGADGEAQFLGVLFDKPVVTEVKLTVGSYALFNFDGKTVQSFGPENLAFGVDLAVTDDFVFATPTAIQPVPLPGAVWMLLSGLPLFLRRRA